MSNLRAVCRCYKTYAVRRASLHDVFYALLPHHKRVRGRTRDNSLRKVDRPVEVDMLRGDLFVVCLSGEVLIERHSGRRYDWER